MRASYYLWIDGKEEGPFSLQEIEARVAREACPPGTLARGDGGSDWVPLESILDQKRSTAEPGVDAGPVSARRSRVRVGVTLVILGLVGIGIWQITRTKLWAETAALGLSLLGAGVFYGLLFLLIIWGVLWTLFPLFVYFFLQDIRAELQMIRRRQ